MDTNERLKHSLRMKFGLAPNEPTDAQLIDIQRDIERIKNGGEDPIQSDWERAIKKHCPSVGNWGYGGVDNSDLNHLLVMATAKPKPRS